MDYGLDTAGMLLSSKCGHMVYWTKDEGFWALLHEATGSPVGLGEELTSFRGETAQAVDGTPPHKPGAAGYVYVEGEVSGEFYPSVFGLRRAKLHTVSGA